MKTSNGAQPQKRKLPYLTPEDLNAPIKAVIIRVVGSYTKRGEQRKEVYEDHYEADIEVPAKYNMGHVKLGINRHIKKELHGIRARTFAVDTDVAPKPVTEPRKVRNFISDQGMLDNDAAKRQYDAKVAKARAEREARESGTWAPPAFSDTTNYDEYGMPPVVKEPGE